MLNLEQTCNNPHLHSSARTVIRTELSAWACQPFCCQRTFFPSRSECPDCLRTCLAGLTRPRCAISPSSSAPVSSGILPRVLVALRLASEIPCGTSSHSSLATNHCRKIKNPASSAGCSHPHGGSTRCSTSFYPVLVKNLTIGSTSCLRLILRWEDFFDPTVMPLNNLRAYRPLRPLITIPPFFVSSSPCNNYFPLFPQPVNSLLKAIFPECRGRLSRLSRPCRSQGCGSSPALQSAPFSQVSSRAYREILA